MYNSPITKIYEDINKHIKRQDEDNIMYVVNQVVRYEVDKDELIKALQYDRNQYKEGYIDAIKEYEDKLKRIRSEIEHAFCKAENDYDHGRNYGFHVSMQIIDKYIQEYNENDTCR